MASNNEAGTSSGAPRTVNGKKRTQWKLPPLLDHFNKRDLKIVFRCWVATWVATLLIFIQPALHQIGIATFFAALTLYIAPPANLLLLYLLSSASALLGMCLAWLWGLLTMKAALAARPGHEAALRQEALEQAAAQRAHETGKTLAYEAKVLVFGGFMLDARVTVVYYVMIVAFVYALARLRLVNPKFSVLQIFGTIVIDVFLLNGPSLPSFNGSLGGILVKPGAIGIGLGAISCLLFFPQSASYSIMDKMGNLLRSCNASIRATQSRFRQEPLALSELNAHRTKMIGAWKVMQPQMPLLSLDLFRCYWGPDDQRKLQGLFRVTLRRSVALVDFQIAAVSTKDQQDMLERYGGEQSKALAANTDSQASHPPGHRHLQDLAKMMQTLHSAEHGTLPDRTTNILRDATSGLLATCSESLELAARCLGDVNSCRWIKKLDKETAHSLQSDLQNKRDTLRRLRENCGSSTPELLQAALKEAFDGTGDFQTGERAQVDHDSLRDVMSTLALEKHIIDLCLSLEASLDYMAALFCERSEKRLWIPITIRNAVSWIFRPKSLDSAESGSSNEAEKVAQERISAARNRERAHALRHNASKRRSGMTKAIIASYRWLTNPAGLFAMRMAIVTIATSIPSAIPHSAGFFYREKGIWFVITAQLTLLPYMADFVLSLFSRAVGTVVGGILGMVAWYIGSGSGNGNPYGLGAITAVFTAVLVWVRLWSPHTFAVAGIMSGATFALVIGFSYDNHHAEQYGLPGQGYEAFWKRTVTVFLGLFAAAIVHIFPKPPSATSHVCRTLAKSVRKISDQYALLLLCQKTPTEYSSLSVLAGHNSLNLANSLSLLSPSIHILKTEMSFGPFDQHNLQRALSECQGLNQSLSRLLDAVHSLPPQLKIRFEAISGILDDHVIGDIMAVLHIIQQSFENAAPLPERLPTPLTRTFYDSWQRHRHSFWDEDVIRQQGYCQYCIAISAYLQFLSTVDNLALLLSQELGESHTLFDWETTEV